MINTESATQVREIVLACVLKTKVANGVSKDKGRWVLNFESSKKIILTVVVVVVNILHATKWVAVIKILDATRGSLRRRFNAIPGQVNVKLKMEWLKVRLNFKFNSPSDWNLKV